MVTVQILVDNVDITADVIFSSCRFASYVNSRPGEASMRVRDSGRTYSFTTGADWLVLVDGDAAWRGFLMSKVDTYIAPALNVTAFGPTRFFDLVGADMNILFSRRAVYDQADPTNVEGTQFPAATADTTAITELLANWLHLSGDDLDTSGGVTHVGSLDPAQKTRAWSGGWTWGNAMDTIAMLPAAIYYLRPEVSSPKATLCYVDVDVPSAPFGLSDTPNHTTTKGYREMEITLDGTSMANDVMAWGMGYGSTVPVFDRETDATSQSNHGLWQTGVIANGVYKQATIDRIATSIIDGSPSSKRGAKNDKPSVSLVTYEPGLLAGHVVPFASHIWGFSDDIPVRQMVLLFEAPDVARYEIVLSHEIDAPWGFVDQFLPVTPGLPQLPCLNPPCYTVTPPGNPQQPSACDCGITDTFTRTTASPDMGIADCGLGYTVTLAHRATAHANGASGIVTLDPSAGSVSAGASSAAMSLIDIEPLAWDTAVSHSIRFSLSNLGDPALDFAELIEIRLKFFNAGTARVVIIPSNASLWLQGSGPHASDPAYSQITWTSDFISGTQIPIGFWGAGTVYTLSVTTLGSDSIASITDDTLTYSIGLGSIPAVPNQVSVTALRDVLGPYTTTTVTTVTLDDLIVPEVTRCAAIQFDDFNRTSASGWGTATPSGAVWTEGGAHSSVSPGYGRASLGSLQQQFEATPTGPWQTTSGFTLTYNFRFSAVGAGVSYTVAVDVFDDDGRMDFFIGVGTAGGGIVEVTSDGDDTEAKTDWVANTWYSAKMEYVPSTVIRAKVWEAGTAEPGSWLASTTALGAVTSKLTFGLLNSAGASRTIDIASIDFDYAGKPCYYDGPTPVTPVGSVPTSPSAWGCENPVRSSSTVYQTAQVFVPQTTFVWRDGLFQRRGTDFTENSGNASITFSTLVTTEVIRMCYFSQGPAA